MHKSQRIGECYNGGGMRLKDFWVGQGYLGRGMVVGWESLLY